MYKVIIFPNKTAIVKY